MSQDPLNVKEDAPPDHIFKAFSSARARLVVAVLAGREEPMAIADLATEIASLEDSVERTNSSGDRIRQIYVSLYHVHIPKLASIEAVTYDADRNTVALIEADEQMMEFLGLSGCT